MISRIFSHAFLKKYGPFPASSLFVNFLFLPVKSKYVYYIIFRCLDSNLGSLTLEATALPTEPQRLPKSHLMFVCELLASDGRSDRYVVSDQK